jgi:hypothetical protein
MELPIFKIYMNFSGHHLCCFTILPLLALSVGQRLGANFYVSRANFLTTLHSHLDITCSHYFWSSLLNLDDENLHTLDN